MTTPVDLRVLKAHAKAVEQVLDEVDYKYVDDPDRFHHDVAAAVLSATDGKTRYVIGARDPAGNAYVFGPYASFSSAMNVIAVGLPAMPEGTRAAVWPLIPAPKAPRKKKEKKP